ncbi:transposase [Streptomyces sp. NPDC058289]|uniref:transposase n=1 Tax=Streptomyces sp. NPDC058289 TaxID=3346425 RepID=UPI0036E95434
MDDNWWALIEPLLPPWPKRSPGPRRVADRLYLQVLRTSSATTRLATAPAVLGFSSGQTCWRRLERWQQAAVFDQPHRIFLAS